MIKHVSVICLCFVLLIDKLQMFQPNLTRKMKALLIQMLLIHLF